MGVPKFYRWLSERYPKINQRFASPPNVETCQRYFDGKLPSEPLDPPDPLALCGLPPEIDRLYLDMNGIIHGCSHNNNGTANTEEAMTTTTASSTGNITVNLLQDDDTNGAIKEDSDDDDPLANNRISRDEIFTNICYYLDRIIGDMVQPKQLVYMAIDGVAPRAKLNQQRSRRYRSGAEGKMETTIYEAHMLRRLQEEQEANDAEEEELRARQEEQKLQQQSKGNGYFWEPSWLSDGSGYSSSNDEEADHDPAAAAVARRRGRRGGGTLLVEEVMPGRFKGKFEQTEAATELLRGGPATAAAALLLDGTSGGHHHADDNADDIFHSNIITPGTPFFQEFTRHLEHFIQYKLNTDPKWQHLTIILSGPNVPGEGEHKIMQFIREQREYAASNTTTSIGSSSNNNNSDSSNHHHHVDVEYNPNLRHCIMGQDGDLVMLGLCTHGTCRRE
jgi:5'-3' exonuclease